MTVVLPVFVRYICRGSLAGRVRRNNITVPTRGYSEVLLRNRIVWEGCWQAHLRRYDDPKFDDNIGSSTPRLVDTGNAESRLSRI